VEVISSLLSKYLHSNTLNYAQIDKSGGSGDGGDTFRLTGGIQRFNQARSHWYQKIQRNAHECCQGRARDYGLWQG
jgi:hypothetical protein